MLKDEIAKIVYEATRIEAEWSKRQIVPEQWEQREQSFREQFVRIVGDYLERDHLPTPEEAHNSWMESYFRMGWTYGERRDVEKKEHPDLVLYSDLPQDERDKDAIFLAFVWEIKEILALLAPELEKARRFDGLNHADSIDAFVETFPEIQEWKEKARKYDESLPLIKEMEDKAKRWDKVCELDPDYETEYDGRTYYFCRFCDGPADDVGNDRHREDCPLVENEDLENGQGAP